MLLCVVNRILIVIPCSVSGSNLPRGLQKVQKTQMLDFSAATAIQESAASELKKVEDGMYLILAVCALCLTFYI